MSKGAEKIFYFGANCTEEMKIAGVIPASLYMETDGMFATGTQAIKCAEEIEEVETKNIVKNNLYIMGEL